jgi:hypothetical protein
MTITDQIPSPERDTPGRPPLLSQSRHLDKLPTLGSAGRHRLHWVHCARTDRYTLLTCHAKRGRTGIDDAGVLGRFRGIAVHDAWAPYDTYVDVEHQLCCAHALRELQAAAETAPPETEWCWAGQAADALVAMQRLVTDAIARSADTVDADALNTQTRLYRGSTAQPPRSASARPRRAPTR